MSPVYPQNKSYSLTTQFFYWYQACSGLFTNTSVRFAMACYTSILEHAICECFSMYRSPLACGRDGGTGYDTIKSIVTRKAWPRGYKTLPMLNSSWNSSCSLLLKCYAQPSWARKMFYNLGPRSIFLSLLEHRFARILCRKATMWSIKVGPICVNAWFFYAPVTKARGIKICPCPSGRLSVRSFVTLHGIEFV